MAVSGYNEAWRTAEDNHLAKMTNSQARAARFLAHDYEMSGRELSRMYGVSHAAMSLILRGVTYTEAGGPFKTVNESYARDMSWARKRKRKRW